MESKQEETETMEGEAGQEADTQERGHADGEADDTAEVLTVMSCVSDTTQEDDVSDSPPLLSCVSLNRFIDQDMGTATCAISDKGSPVIPVQYVSGDLSRQTPGADLQHMTIPEDNRSELCSDRTPDASQSQSLFTSLDTTTAVVVAVDDGDLPGQKMSSQAAASASQLTTESLFSQKMFASTPDEGSLVAEDTLTTTITTLCRHLTSTADLDTAQHVTLVLPNDHNRPEVSPEATKPSLDKEEEAHDRFQPAPLPKTSCESSQVRVEELGEETHPSQHVSPECTNTDKAVKPTAKGCVQKFKVPYRTHMKGDTRPSPSEEHLGLNIGLVNDEKLPNIKKCLASDAADAVQTDETQWSKILLNKERNHDSDLAGDTGEPNEEGHRPNRTAKSAPGNMSPLTKSSLDSVHWEKSGEAARPNMTGKSAIKNMSPFTHNTKSSLDSVHWEKCGEAAENLAQWQENGPPTQVETFTLNRNSERSCCLSRPGTDEEHDVRTGAGLNNALESVTVGKESRTGDVVIDNDSDVTLPPVAVEDRRVSRSDARHKTLPPPQPAEWHHAGSGTRKEQFEDFMENVRAISSRVLCSSLDHMDELLALERLHSVLDKESVNVSFTAKERASITQRLDHVIKHVNQRQQEEKTALANSVKRKKMTSEEKYVTKQQLQSLTERCAVLRKLFQINQVLKQTAKAVANQASTSQQTNSHGSHPTTATPHTSQSVCVSLMSDSPTDTSRKRFENPVGVADKPSTLLLKRSGNLPINADNTTNPLRKRSENQPVGLASISQMRSENPAGIQDGSVNISQRGFENPAGIPNDPSRKTHETPPVLTDGQRTRRGSRPPASADIDNTVIDTVSRQCPSPSAKQSNVRINKNRCPAEVCHPRVTFDVITSDNVDEVDDREMSQSILQVGTVPRRHNALETTWKRSDEYHKETPKQKVVFQSACDAPSSDHRPSQPLGLVSKLPRTEVSRILLKNRSGGFADMETRNSQQGKEVEDEVIVPMQKDTCVVVPGIVHSKDTTVTRLCDKDTMDIEKTQMIVEEPIPSSVPYTHIAKTINHIGVSLLPSRLLADSEKSFDGSQPEVNLTSSRELSETAQPASKGLGVQNPRNSFSACKESVPMSPDSDSLSQSVLQNRSASVSNRLSYAQPYEEEIPNGTKGDYNLASVSNRLSCAQPNEEEKPNKRKRDNDLFPKGPCDSHNRAKCLKDSTVNGDTDNESETMAQEEHSSPGSSPTVDTQGAVNVNDGELDGSSLCRKRARVSFQSEGSTSDDSVLILDDPPLAKSKRVNIMRQDGRPSATIISESVGQTAVSSSEMIRTEKNSLPSRTVHGHQNVVPKPQQNMTTSSQQNVEGRPHQNNISVSKAKQNGVSNPPQHAVSKPHLNVALKPRQVVITETSEQPQTKGSKPPQILTIQPSQASTQPPPALPTKPPPHKPSTKTPAENKDTHAVHRPHQPETPALQNCSAFRRPMSPSSSWTSMTDVFPVSSKEILRRMAEQSTRKKKTDAPPTNTSACASVAGESCVGECEGDDAQDASSVRASAGDDPKVMTVMTSQSMTGGPGRGRPLLPAGTKVIVLKKLPQKTSAAKATVSGHGARAQSAPVTFQDLISRGDIQPGKLYLHVFFKVAKNNVQHHCPNSGDKAIKTGVSLGLKRSQEIVCICCSKAGEALCQSQTRPKRQSQALKPRVLNRRSWTRPKRQSQASNPRWEQQDMCRWIDQPGHTLTESHPCLAAMHGCRSWTRLKRQSQASETSIRGQRGTLSASTARKQERHWRKALRMPFNPCALHGKQGSEKRASVLSDGRVRDEAGLTFSTPVNWYRAITAMPHAKRSTAYSKIRYRGVSLAEITTRCQTSYLPQTLPHNPSSSTLPPVPGTTAANTKTSLSTTAPPHQQILPALPKPPGLSSHGRQLIEIRQGPGTAIRQRQEAETSHRQHSETPHIGVSEISQRQNSETAHRQQIADRQRQQDGTTTHRQRAETTQRRESTWSSGYHQTQARPQGDTAHTPACNPAREGEGEWSSPSRVAALLAAVRSLRLIENEEVEPHTKGTSTSCELTSFWAADFATITMSPSVWATVDDWC